MKKMRYWVEVTGDFQWQLRLKGEMGLNAPMISRYKNMLSNIHKGDIILHHIVTSRAISKEHESAVIGISKVKNKMYTYGKKVIVDLEDSLELLILIKLKELFKYQKTI
jgi:hypothetical protein